MAVLQVIGREAGNLLRPRGFRSSRDREPARPRVSGHERKRGNARGSLAASCSRGPSGASRARRSRGVRSSRGLRERRTSSSPVPWRAAARWRFEWRSAPGARAHPAADRRRAPPGVRFGGARVSRRLRDDGGPRRFRAARDPPAVRDRRRPARARVRVRGGDRGRARCLAPPRPARRLGGSRKALRSESVASARASARFRAVLVVSQVSLALILFAGAGLLVRTFERLRHFDLGFRPEEWSRRASDFPRRYASPEKRLAFFEHLFGRLESASGVAAAGG